MWGGWEDAGAGETVLALEPETCVQSQFHLLLAVWPWKSHLTSRSSDSALICKMRSLFLSHRLNVRNSSTNVFYFR